MNVAVVDIGNTSISYGLATGSRVIRASQVAVERHGRRGIRGMLATLSRGRRVHGAVCGSVVPARTADWLAGLREISESRPIEVTHRLKLGIRIAYPRPGTIGADRLANACGAAARYGTPVIVADFGTALTFDVLAGGGVYAGGIIAPGLPLMTDYLAERTALLPRLRLRKVQRRVGKSTVEAMCIGARFGYRGMVREVIETLSAEPGLAGAALCATGGFARWVLEDLDLPFAFDPNLTLFGLGRIFELNTE